MLVVVQDDEGRFWVEEPDEFGRPYQWGPFVSEERAREAAIQAMKDDGEGDEDTDDDAGEPAWRLV